jgi:hypothetical protein
MDQLELEPDAERAPYLHFAGADTVLLILDRRQARELRSAMAWAAKRMQPSARAIYGQLHEWLERPPH